MPLNNGHKDMIAGVMATTIESIPTSETQLRKDISLIKEAIDGINSVNPKYNHFKEFFHNPVSINRIEDYNSESHIATSENTRGHMIELLDKRITTITSSLGKNVQELGWNKEVILANLKNLGTEEIITQAGNNLNRDVNPYLSGLNQPDLDPILNAYLESDNAQKLMNQGILTTDKAKQLGIDRLRILASDEMMTFLEGENPKLTIDQACDWSVAKLSILKNLNSPFDKVSELSHDSAEKIYEFCFKHNVAPPLRSNNYKKQAFIKLVERNPESSVESFYESIKDCNQIQLLGIAEGLSLEQINNDRFKEGGMLSNTTLTAILRTKRDNPSMTINEIYEKTIDLELNQLCGILKGLNHEQVTDDKFSKATFSAFYFVKERNSDLETNEAYEQVINLEQHQLHGIIKGLTVKQVTDDKFSEEVFEKIKEASELTFQEAYSQQISNAQEQSESSHTKRVSSETKGNSAKRGRTF